MSISTTPAQPVPAPSLTAPIPPATMAFVPMTHLCALFDVNAFIMPRPVANSARRLGDAATAATTWLTDALSAADAGDMGSANDAARRAVEVAGPAATEAARVACILLECDPVLAPSLLRAAAALLHLAATTLVAAAAAKAAAAVTNAEVPTHHILALDACLPMARRRAADAEGAYVAARDARDDGRHTAVLHHQAGRAMLHARAGAAAAQSMAASVFPTAPVLAAVLSAHELRVLGAAFRLFAEAANSATLAQALLPPGDAGEEEVDDSTSDTDLSTTEPWDPEA